jgi:Type II secretion system (T2SS), protein E, N-terminal domain
VLEHSLSEAERSQILQTIEMFEVITQTQPDDYQSLEILKVAYQKLGKTEEASRLSRRLAEAYFNAGSFSLAMQECESVLASEPGAPDMLALLGEIEAKLHGPGHTRPDAGAQNALIAPNYTTTNPTADGGLLEIGGRNTGKPRKKLSPEDAQQGNDQLAKFLIVQQLFAEEEVNAALLEVMEVNRAATGSHLAASLLDRLCQGDDSKMESVLSALIDRTKFAYVPLEYYDIDRQVVRMLPDELTINRLFVPFDLISRTIMVAVCNPFDAAAREEVQQSLDYTVTWYLAKPATIIKTLQEIYRLGPQG